MNLELVLSENRVTEWFSVWMSSLALMLSAGPPVLQEWWLAWAGPEDSERESNLATYI